MKNLFLVSLLLLTSCSTSPNKHGRNPANYDENKVYFHALNGINLDEWLNQLLLFAPAKKNDESETVKTQILEAYHQANEVRGFYTLLLEKQVAMVGLNSGAQKLLIDGLFAARKQIRLENSETYKRQALYLLDVLTDETLFYISIRTPGKKAVTGRIYLGAKENLINCQGRVANLNTLKVCQGDIVASKGGAGTSSFLARIADFPGNMSHSTIAYVRPEDKKLFFAEAFIEDGVKLRSAESDYIKHRKRRLFVYRYKGKDAAQVIQNAIAATDQFIEDMKVHSNNQPETIASFPYDFDMDAASPNAEKAYFCSEISYAIYKKGGMIDTRNPYPSEYWSLTSGPNGKFMKFLGVNSSHIPSPADVELNSNFDMVGFEVDTAELQRDRVDLAITDAVFFLLRQTILSLEDQDPNAPSRKLVKFLDRIGSQSISRADFEKLKAIKILPEKRIAEFAEKVPDNVNLKQALFFAYMNNLLIPNLAPKIQALEKEHIKKQGRPLGLLELRQLVQPQLQKEFQLLTDQLSKLGLI